MRILGSDDRRESSEPGSQGEGDGLGDLVLRPKVREGFSRTRFDLERWRTGDVGGFEAIWQRYQPALRCLIAREIAAIGSPLVRKKIESEEVLQRAMEVVVKKLKVFEYQGPGSLYGWMEAIATNQVREMVGHWGREKRDPRRERELPVSKETDADPQPSIRDPAPGPLTQTVRKESDDKVARALASLPERDSKMIILRYYMGAEWEEIALTLGSSSGDAVQKEHARLLPRIGMYLRNA